MKKDPMLRLGVARGEGGLVRRDSLDEALDRIYERHVTHVHRWVRRLMGPRDDVEDVIHEVFLVAMRRRGEFRGDGKLMTWLFRITAMVVRDRRGRERARRWLFARHGQDLAIQRGPAVTPLEEIERRERVARLYAALDRLPERYRTPIILYEIDGMSGEELADLLGMKVGAVWVRLHRGRARLLRELAREEDR